MTSSTVPCHPVFAGCEVDLKCFGVASETVPKQFEKAAIDAGTDIKLSWKAAEGAFMGVFLVPQVVIAVGCGLHRISCRCTSA